MRRLTMFSWGYYGWGNATEELVRAVDSVEKNRGFRPPLFVDIRIRRSVRAPGFSERAFENLLGPRRYFWMKELGNRSIVSRTGPRIQIAEPAHAQALLGLAMEAGRSGRRVIFFCSCEHARYGREISCHRWTVGSLLLKAARRDGVPLKIVEWPGGDARYLSLRADSDERTAVLAGRKSILVPRGMSLADSAGLPWGSVLAIPGPEESLQVVSGPARFTRDEWVFLVYRWFFDYPPRAPAIERESSALRRKCGCEARQ